MSILIKGMPMPTRCDECPFLEATSCEEDGRDFKCSMTGLYTTPRIKFIRCPLVEIPPHGDLIDRDAVYRRIHKAIDDDPQLSDVYVEDAQIVTEWLRTEPTIIEAELDCATCPVKGKACKVFYRDKGDHSVCRELREAEGEE